MYPQALTNPKPPTRNPKPLTVNLETVNCETLIPESINQVQRSGMDGFVGRVACRPGWRRPVLDELGRPRADPARVRGQLLRVPRHLPGVSRRHCAGLTHSLTLSLFLVTFLPPHKPCNLCHNAGLTLSLSLSSSFFSLHLTPSTCAKPDTCTCDTAFLRHEPCTL